MIDQCIDCTRTDEAVCPHCGHEHTYTLEWFSHPSAGDGSLRSDVHCESCNERFVLTMHVDVSYSTWKPQPAETEQLP